MNGLVVTDPAVVASVCGRGGEGLDKADIIYGPINQASARPHVCHRLLQSARHGKPPTRTAAPCAPADVHAARHRPQPAHQPDGRRVAVCAQGCGRCVLHGQHPQEVAGAGAIEPRAKRERTHTRLCGTCHHAEARAQVIQSCASKMVSQLEALAVRAGGPVTVDVDQVALRVTLDVIGLVRCGWGLRCGWFAAVAGGNALAAAGPKYHQPRAAHSLLRPHCPLPCLQGRVLP